MRTAAALACLALMLTGCLRDGGFLDDRGGSVTHPEALLRGSPFSRLVVDVDYMAGAEPTPEALDLAFGAMRGVVDKESITIEPATEIPGGANVWSSSTVEDAALSAKDDDGPVIGSDGVARMHVLYLRGTYGNATDDSIASGLYDPGTATVFLFPDTWRDPGIVAIALLSSGIPPSWLEAEVLTHEIGHAMGLVNFGVPALTPRIAPGDECMCHSARRTSVMYPGVHNAQDHLQGILDRQAVGPIGYDADDVADLAAYREGRTGPPLR